MAKITTITNPLTGQPAQVDQLDHTAQQIDDAIARALPGGAIDITLQNKADRNNGQYINGLNLVYEGSEGIDRGRLFCSYDASGNGIVAIDAINADGSDKTRFMVRSNGSIARYTAKNGGSFGSAEEVAYVKRQYYIANGVLLDGSSEIRGTGTATVCIDTNGIARVDFSIKITATSTDSSSFDYGISTALLTAINANIPHITPMTGGVLSVMRDGILNYSVNGYGAYLIDANSRWTPIRIHKADGSAGVWSSTAFSINDVLIGTCYGTVN